MKVKPKETLLNVPIAIVMNDSDEAANFAANINTVLHGKVKIKTDYVGSLLAGEVFIFYLQRNNEFTELREEFLTMIENEEMESNKAQSVEDILAEQKIKPSISDKYDESFGDDKLCKCGHIYYRHFDSYEHMSAIGCKYCHSHSENEVHIFEEYCPFFSEVPCNCTEKYRQDGAHMPDCDVYKMFNMCPNGHIVGKYAADCDYECIGK